MYSNEKVAVKFESKQCRFPQLVREGEIMRDLAGEVNPNSHHSSNGSTNGGSQQQHALVNVGVPRLRFLGETMNHRCLVQDLLGDSIEYLFQQQNCYFSMKTVLLLADQIISRIEYVHYKGYVHRDIKPENFLMGRHGTHQSLCVYIIDFGLSKQFRDPRTHRHIPFKINKSLTGTARYASINNHKGMEQSRRDDLESIGYMLIYFLRRGLLPWQNLSAKTKEEKYARICEKKQGTSLQDLCNGFPDEFRILVQYARSLQFTDTPDYSYLRQLFQNLFVRSGLERDYIFDWCSNMTSSY